MLTGHTPFEGANFSQLFEKHLRQAAPKVRDYVGDCPAELESVIAKLLEKRPEDRPFNARTVQGIMMKLLDETDTRKTAPPVSPTSPVSSSPATASVVKDVCAADAQADYGQRRLERRLSQRESMVRELNWRPVIILLLLVVAVITLALVFR